MGIYVVSKQTILTSSPVSLEGGLRWGSSEEAPDVCARAALPRLKLVATCTALHSARPSDLRRHGPRLRSESTVSDRGGSHRDSEPPGGPPPQPSPKTIWGRGKVLRCAPG